MVEEAAVAQVNLGVDRMSERAMHEAAHMAAMKVLGYTPDRLRLDLRWGDFGFHGAADGIRRTTGDAAREPFDFARIAAIGPLLGGVDLEDAAAAADRRCIDAWCMEGWPLELWRMNATEQARRLARTEEFRSVWTPLVVAFKRLGEKYLDLKGAEAVERFIERSVALVG
jgi:hypothetical protein